MNTINMSSPTIPMDTAVCRTRRVFGWLLKAKQRYRASVTLSGAIVEAADHRSAEVDVVAIAGTALDAADDLRRLAPSRTRSLIVAHLGDGLDVKGATVRLIHFEAGVRVRRPTRSADRTRRPAQDLGSGEAG